MSFLHSEDEHFIHHLLFFFSVSLLPLWTQSMCFHFYFIKCKELWFWAFCMDCACPLYDLKSLEPHSLPSVPTGLQGWARVLYLAQTFMSVNVFHLKTYSEGNVFEVFGSPGPVTCQRTFDLSWIQRHVSGCNTWGSGVQHAPTRRTHQVNKSLTTVSVQRKWKCYYILKES